MNILDVSIRSVLIRISFITMLILLLITPSRALDIGIGANTWYTWWNIDAPEEQNPKFKPALLYGPLASVRFLDDWSIASVFLYGKFDNKVLIKNTVRYDSDTSLNYTINKYFKIFAGFKYMGYEWESDWESGEGYHRAKGAGLGIALTVPIGDSLFFLVNISGLYLSGEEYQEIYWPWLPNETGITEMGINSTASLAYYFQDISTSLIVGFRVQNVKVDYEEDLYAEDATMLFYGITFSAVYSFDM